MPAPDRDPPSPDLHPAKRPRQSSPDKDSPASQLSGAGAGAITPTGDHIPDGILGHGSGTGSTGDGVAGKVGQSSSFRNVSACERCRLRKNRCDQNLPSCASCDKANVACYGYDPINKRRIPRSYVFFLEKRVKELEGILTDNNIDFPPPEDFDYSCMSGSGPSSVRSPVEPRQPAYPTDGTDAASSSRRESNGDGGVRRQQPHQRTVSNPRRASADAAATNNRYLGSTSGISFARVVFAAVQSSVSDQKSNSDKGSVRPYRPAPNGGGGNGAPGPGTSMRDSFFGLHTRPTIHPATFPGRELGLRLISLYFEHANPQIPVLHKGEFMEMFERAYADEVRGRGPRELYVLSMVFAIGAGIIVGDSKGEPPPAADASSGSRQCQPEEYHASAIVHLEACLGSSGGLEDLQAVLLLANFALLRPVPPGLWYIIGVAVRLAVDLGLHYEDGKDLEIGVGVATAQKEALAKEKGRREYVRDLRRRLWWCTYSFDRLVSVCVGRPFGISDQVITTEFPSLLEDRYITTSGIVQPPPEMLRPSYKLVGHHYFRLRLLQSEILQVLQFRQAESARASGQNRQNPYIHTELPSPFLSKFDSFRSWRIDVDRRLWEWKNAAPTKEDAGVAFSTDFFHLNYWQAIIMLYRQSLSVPTVFEGEYDTTKEVNSPAVYNAELREDEDRVYLKVAEAGQKILRLYRQLHRDGLVNHTYLTTHHLFVAGISYLYAIWHSPIVRSRLSMDEVDFTILAATSVFTDFMDKCPPAEACRDAFDRTVKATLKMVNASGGFGQQYHPGQGSGASSSRNSLDLSRIDWSARSDSTSMSGKHHHKRQHHHQPSDQTSTAIPDAYSHNPSLLSAFQKGAQYRLPGGPAVKAEPDAFGQMRKFPVPPRSNASSTDNPVTPEATANLDQQLMPSPSAIQHQQQLSPPLPEIMSQQSLATGARTPTGGFLSPRPQQQQQQQQQRQFSPGPGALGFGDLQGLDFLQGTVGGGNGVTEDGTGLDGIDFSGLADTQMDLGFGLGWEGLHHDFNDGQSLDLFDGFFFGGTQQQQQGGGQGGGGG